MFAGAEQRFVQRSQFLKNRPARQQAVKFKELAGFSAHLRAYIGHRLVAKAELLVKAAPPVRFENVRFASGHMDDFVHRRADAVERADQRSVGLLGALEQRGKPAGRDFYIVVDKQDVLGIRVPQTDVPRLVGREVMLRPYQPKSLLSGFPFQVAPDGRR
jgi:hypothetical protein